MYCFESHFNDLINGYYLVSNGTNIGVLRNSNEVQVYTMPSKDGKNVQLHTYPVGVVDHALALSGQGALLSFTDVINPGKTSSSSIDWNSFNINTSSSSTKPANSLEYRGTMLGKWVATNIGSNEWLVQYRARKFLSSCPSSVDSSH
jgi:hypothetical protein